jgi:hypothetical protein
MERQGYAANDWRSEGEQREAWGLLPMNEDLEVEALNLDTRLVTFTDGTTGPVVDMFDEDGEDTDDHDYAVACIVEHKTAGRGFVEIPDDFENGSIQ